MISQLKNIKKHFSVGLFVLIWSLFGGLLCYASEPLVVLRPVFIIIHGTWSADQCWYMPGGDFFNALEETIKKINGSVISFTWSGGTTDHDRMHAAVKLAKLIDSYGSDAQITLVGHSHGGNVALLASGLIEHQKIHCLYTLGTPIRKDIYPDTKKVHVCYNLFSFEDLVQPVFGMFEREHAYHERVYNICVFLNDKAPDHTDLHHPTIGKWLFAVHDIIRKHPFDGFAPGVLSFYDTKKPHYQIDAQRQNLLDRDHQVIMLMLNQAWRTSLATESKSPLINL